MSARPMVSVIIPVHNGARFLLDALDSGWRQGDLLQEVIVVDDGSTDETRSVVDAQGGRCRYVYQRNAGPAAARNTGLAMAQGEVLGFLDADDVWPDGKLAAQLPALLTGAADAVLGRVQWFRSPVASGHRQWLGRPFFSYHLGSALFRASLFRKVGGFDPSLRYSEDVDWFTRARESGAPMVLLETIGLLYRCHESSMTRGKDPRSLKILTVIKRSLDRRRQPDGRVLVLPPLERRE